MEGTECYSQCSDGSNLRQRPSSPSPDIKEHVTIVITKIIYWQLNIERALNNRAMMARMEKEGHRKQQMILWGNGSRILCKDIAVKCCDIAIRQLTYSPVTADYLDRA